MDTTQENLKLDIENWRLRVDERSRGRMKLQVKLSKDEAVAYKNFASMVKPEEVSDDDFIKTIFLSGFETMNSKLVDLVKKYADENREDLASSGITVIDSEDGGIKLAETSTLEHEVSGI